mgnify:CR=1 FL=1
MTLREFCSMVVLSGGSKTPVLALFHKQNGKTKRLGYFCPTTMTAPGLDGFENYLDRPITGFPSSFSTFGVEVSVD